MAEDKNSEQCVECPDRLKYAVGEGMLSEEGLEQKEDPVVKEDREAALKKKKKKTKIIDPKKKETWPIAPKKKQKYKDRNFVHLSFPEKYDDIYHELVRIADLEMRKVGIQAIYFIKQGIENWKENHKDG